MAALSQYLCQAWHWRNAAGRLKDLAARTLLRTLHATFRTHLTTP